MGELAENKEEEAIQTTHQKQNQKHNQRAFSQIQPQVANTNNKKKKEKKTVFHPSDSKLAWVKRQIKRHSK
jgi:hypothetical protein